MADVTVTLPEGDFDAAILDIWAAHGEYCIDTDKCNCEERVTRMARALEKALGEHTEP